VTGIHGEAERYRQFMTSFDGDAIPDQARRNNGASTRCWPVLDDIKVRGGFVPCGFSGLYEPSFTGYFAQMPGSCASLTI